MNGPEKVDGSELTWTAISNSLFVSKWMIGPGGKNGRSKSRFIFDIRSGHFLISSGLILLRTEANHDDNLLF